MCTYSLRTARAADVLDVMRSHQVTVARRKGDWEFLEAPGRQARKGGGTGGAHRFPGREFLTERELATLSEIVRGATSKQAGRALGISPRTVEFHRENIMRKLRVKNIAELISKVLGAD
jgi:DNA-binding CsgD family transcriptional regulator